MDSIFGTLPEIAKFIIAFVIVIALIALTAWLVRRFGAARLGAGAARGRQPRLAVIDAAPVDGRRRLVLIRRDNVEHLLIIGGPTDVVVEQNIVRASARNDRVAASEPAQRSLPLDNGMSTSLQPSPEPAPITPARSARASFGDDNWTASEPPRDAPAAREPSREPPPRPRPDSLTGMAADLSAKLGTPDLGSSFGRSPAPAETFGRNAPPVEPARQPETVPDKPDHNLAEMASRLEAALRRPPEGRPPVTDPLAVAPVNPPRPRTEFRAPEVKAPEAFTPPPPQSDNKAASKAIYDSLEQEMASLLGRPANKQ